MQSTFYTIRIFARPEWPLNAEAIAHDVCFSDDYGWYVYETPEHTKMKNINICMTLEDAIREAALVKGYKFQGKVVERVMIETHTVSTTSREV